MDLLYLEALGPNVFEGLAKQVVSVKSEEEWRQETLACPDDSIRAPDVFEQEKTTARAQDAMCFDNRLSVVWNRTKGKRDDDRLEVLIGEIEPLGIDVP
jgi:hypothetical protein